MAPPAEKAFRSRCSLRRPAVGGYPALVRGKADKGKPLNPWAALDTISRNELAKRKSRRNDDGTLAGRVR